MNKEINVEIQKSRSAKEAGFTLVESVIAIAIITIGLIGTAAAITTAFKFTRVSRNITDAKAIALAQLEQIHSLRDSKALNFRQINNTLDVNNARARVDFDGFELPTADNGFFRVSNTPGADGIFGTQDDPNGPGPDLVYGTADDDVKVGYTRKTKIVDVLPNLKSIVVTVRYPGNDGNIYELSATGYLNNDLKQN